ncbi:MAG TPA: DNA replication/repair protein RecF [Candidatus Limnocylindria bacterium]|nr:DNA replication/repair protein RecF [Candidatus Limnocylindria bacterium]
MRVRSLALEHFRSYERVTLALSPAITAFVGANGAGKTNLLEAIALVATGSSARARDDSEVIRWDAPFARITALIERAEDERKVELLVFAPQDGERRRARRWLVNGAGRRPEDAVGSATVVSFFPEDVALFSDGPSGRRRHLDTTLSQVDRAHRADVRELARVLEQRNALLRTLRDGTGTAAELAFWDTELCRLSAAVSLRRIALVRDLAPAYERAIGRFAGPRTMLRYVSQTEGDTVDERAEGYLRLVLEKRERELWQGATLVGPHREDLAVSADGHAIATFASRGEQRAAVLALRLAEAEWLTSRTSEPPIFLLDDVLSELDPARRDALVAALPEGAQALLTASVPSGLPASLTARGSIVPVPFA